MTQTPSLDDPAMTVAQVAKIFAVTQATVRVWMREGRITGFKLPDSNRWRVLQSEVHRFAQQNYGEN